MLGESQVKAKNFIFYLFGEARSGWEWNKQARGELKAGSNIFHFSWASAVRPSVTETPAVPQNMSGRSETSTLLITALSNKPVLHLGSKIAPPPAPSILHLGAGKLLIYSCRTNPPPPSPRRWQSRAARTASVP